MIYNDITTKEALRLIKSNYNLKNIKVVTDDITNRTMKYNKDNGQVSFKRNNECLSVCCNTTTKKQFLDNFKMLFREVFTLSTTFTLELTD